MAKATKKAVKKAPKKQAGSPVAKPGAKKPNVKKVAPGKPGPETPGPEQPGAGPATPALPRDLFLPSGEVLDRLYGVVLARREADPALSHSARLLSRGPAKVAQKFGEEAVEALIEAVAGNKANLIGESADVLYHLLVLWVAAGVRPAEVWAELQRREGVSGVVEKAGRTRKLPALVGTTKIP